MSFPLMLNFTTQWLHSVALCWLNLQLYIFKWSPSVTGGSSQFWPFSLCCPHTLPGYFLRLAKLCPISSLLSHYMSISFVFLHPILSDEVPDSCCPQFSLVSKHPLRTCCICNSLFHIFQSFFLFSFSNFSVNTLFFFYHAAISSKLGWGARSMSVWGRRNFGPWLLRHPHVLQVTQGPSPSICTVSLKSIVYLSE